MPRAPADRPIRGTGEGAALRAARERGAAPLLPDRPSEPDPPAFGRQVAQASPGSAAGGVGRHKVGRSFALAKPRKKESKESPGREPAADPGGRGRSVDVRV
ncbi:MAG: hypothetical protein HY293_04835 [Planctomycetes bacterium]|nr:hypothetical protein [Planctomycetota bacterium]